MNRTNMNNKQRVVVTGLGAVSSIGIGWQEFWKNLIAGKSGISEVESFDTTDFPRKYGGEVKNFDPSKYLKLKVMSYGRSSQLGLVAAKLALDDAKIFQNSDFQKNCVVIAGTTGGERKAFEEFKRKVFNQKSVQINDYYKILNENIPNSISRYFGIRGRSILISTACAAGNYAISLGYDLIKHNKCKYALVGGADGFAQMVFTGFCRLNAVATNKCQPFDVNREGMIPAEGSGFLFLESEESFINRGVKSPYAEILGGGFACDAYHITRPSLSGLEKTIRKSLTNAHIAPEQIDYICAHGTGTKENDIIESQAIANIFKRNTINSPYVSSIKSMLGHTMGASAALGAIACCLSITHNIIPPNINLLEQDPGCAIRVPRSSFKKEVKFVFNNSQAFGGNNAGLIFGRNKKC